jgi:membrane protease YdiL (CAAX protease family)
MARSESATRQQLMPRRFLLFAILLWVAGSIAGWVYARQQDIPRAIFLPVLAALLVEATFYISIAWEELRRDMPRVLLLFSAPLPYLIYSVPCGEFSLRSLIFILAAAAVILFWFRFLPRGRITDFAFVGLIAAAILMKVFPLVYVRPHPKIAIEILGHLAWIRLAAVTVLRDRRMEGVNFGFWPKAREWQIGTFAYLAALPVIWTLLGVTGVARFAWPVHPWWQTIGIAAATFLGILWVVALSEELFFRGLIQQWLEEILGSSAAAILTTAVLFGAAHLGFRFFPNWKFSLLAALAGLFYGWAFYAGRGVRAAMVAHALLVTTWRVLFR